MRVVIVEITSEPVDVTRGPDDFPGGYPGDTYHRFVSGPRRYIAETETGERVEVAEADIPEGYKPGEWFEL
jgi:hypothetical protein